MAPKKPSIKKKAEVKFQNFGKKIRTGATKLVRQYKAADKKASDRYMASPAGKKAKQILNAGGGF